MRLHETLNAWFDDNCGIRRIAWPAGDFILADDDANTVWYYTDATDNLAPDFEFDFQDMLVTDWEIMQ